MNRRRAITIAAAMLFTLPTPQFAFAQQAEAPTAPPHGLPSVDDHLRMLAEKLDLTQDQQDKARPIITEMQAEMQKTMDDKSLTQDEARAKTHAAFLKADKQFRVFLSDDQKMKLDDLEQQMHPGTDAHNPSPHK
jgi:Skp family chaperone for outer membrane proteins